VGLWDRRINRLVAPGAWSILCCRSEPGPAQGPAPTGRLRRVEADDMPTTRILVVLSERGYWAEELVGSLEKLDAAGYEATSGASTLLATSGVQRYGRYRRRRARPRSGATAVPARVHPARCHRLGLRPHRELRPRDVGRRLPVRHREFDAGRLPHRPRDGRRARAWPAALGLVAGMVGLRGQPLRGRPAALSARERRPSLSRMCSACASAGRVPITSLSAMSLLVRPRAISVATSRSCCVSRADPPAPRRSVRRASAVGG
jgi:hypothetical protein